MARRESSAPESPGVALGAQLVLLALWLGASLFFALGVAPAAFAVLPARELAGALVGRLLPVLFWTGAALGGVLISLGLLQHGRSGFRRSRVVAATVISLSCLVAQLGVAPRIASLRATVAAPLASLPPADPQRILFGRLHMLSVAWLALAMMAATVSAALLLVVLRSRGKP